jgi:RNA polymerase sigma-70 factor (ECF subfamily)
VLRPNLLHAEGCNVIESTARGAWQDLEARLRPFVARRVRSSADVDDVVQDIFLRMQRGLAGLRDDERFGPWVYRVARSAIADHHRGAARHAVSSAPADDEPAPTSDEEGDPEAYAAVLGCIAPFVATLQPPYREAITLAELEGVTQREAADMLGVSVSAMKSRVQRGRMQLREALDSCCRIALDGRGRVQGCEPRKGQPSGAPCGGQDAQPGARKG